MTFSNDEVTITSGNLLDEDDESSIPTDEIQSDESSTDEDTPTLEDRSDDECSDELEDLDTPVVDE
jgi:hypothetical protein